MSRRSRYRELQASVPGLERLYRTLGTRIAAASNRKNNVLIVGGGGGREIELFAQRDATARLTVVDPSASNLDDAKAVAREMNYRGEIEFVEGTVDRLPATAVFDTVMIIFVLHAIHQAEEEQHLLSSVRSRLADGGTLLLADICFADAASIEDMIATYEDHARAKDTARDLIDLEIRSVKERRDRTELSLGTKLKTAGLETTSLLDRALWYAAFSVEPV